MHCPNCRHDLHVSHLGVTVCLHCGYVGQVESVPASESEPAQLRRRRKRLRLRQLWVMPHPLIAIIAAVVILISGAGVAGTLLVENTLHAKLAASTVSKSKTVMVIAPPKPPSVTPVIDKPTTTTPKAVPVPAQPAPKLPEAAPAPVSPIVSNSLCRVDATQAPDLVARAQDMASVCQTVFPQIESMLSPSPCAPLHNIVFDYNKYAAYAQNCVVHVSIDWLRNDPYDPGLIPHELTHIVQGYGSIAPGWITEGIATYMSYKLGYSIGIAHCNSNETYLAGYGCGASLFNYIERVYKPTIVKDVHLAIKANTYSDAIFQTETAGRDLTQLYNECLQAECKGGASL